MSTNIIHFGSAIQVLDRLYFGSKSTLKVEIIEYFKITDIINCAIGIRTNEDVNNSVNSVTNLKMFDIFNQVKLERGYNKLNELYSDEDKIILVNCSGGMSRSVSLVMLFLMRNYEVSYDEAYTHIKKLKSMINPFVEISEM